MFEKGEIKVSKTARKIVVICMAIAAIGLIIQIVSAILDPATISIPGITTTGIIPVIFGIFLLSSKKNDDDKK